MVPRPWRPWRPRLLGISKKAVYRLDNDTKEILQKWELESIQRWAAGPKNATLDFGEYAEVPYAVKEKIKNLPL